MADQVGFRRRCKPRRSPLSTNLARLGVIPAAPESLVVNDDKHVRTRLFSTFRDRNPAVVCRKVHVIIADDGSAARNQWWLGAAGRRVEYRCQGPRREPVTAYRQGRRTGCSVD